MAAATSTAGAQSGTSGATVGPPLNVPIGGPQTASAASSVHLPHASELGSAPARTEPFGPEQAADVDPLPVGKTSPPMVAGVGNATTLALAEQPPLPNVTQLDYHLPNQLFIAQQSASAAGVPLPVSNLSRRRFGFWSLLSRRNFQPRPLLVRLSNNTDFYN